LGGNQLLKSNASGDFILFREKSIKAKKSRKKKENIIHQKLMKFEQKFIKLVLRKIINRTGKGSLREESELRRKDLSYYQAFC